MTKREARETVHMPKRTAVAKKDLRYWLKYTADVCQHDRYNILLLCNDHDVLEEILSEEAEARERLGIAMARMASKAKAYRNSLVNLGSGDIRVSHCASAATTEDNLRILREEFGLKEEGRETP